jgi:putative endonuclease
MSRRWVYVLRSVVDRERYYVGVTSDAVARLAEHNTGVCRHTNKYRPWQLHVRIEFPDERRASAFEKYLKSGSGRAFATRHFE